MLITLSGGLDDGYDNTKDHVIKCRHFRLDTNGDIFIDGENSNLSVADFYGRIHINDYSTGKHKFFVGLTVEE